MYNNNSNIYHTNSNSSFSNNQCLFLGDRVWEITPPPEKKYTIHSPGIEVLKEILIITNNKYY
jgi:hypothetical protein